MSAHTGHGLTRQLWTFAALVGWIVLAVGLYLGLSGVTVAGEFGGQDCGAAFGSDSAYALLDNATIAACDTKRSDRRTEAIVVLIVGGGLTGLGYFALRSSDDARKE